MSKRMGMCSLFLIILCLFTTQIHAGCFSQTPTGFESVDFYSSPTNVTIDACDISNENSCCTFSLSHQISSYSDPWTSGLITFFSYTTTSCRGALQGASCLLCSAEQSNFVRFHSIYAQVYLCSAYCQEIYNSCSTSRKSGESPPLSISEDYTGDYSSFCYDLFETLSPLNVQLVLDSTSTDNCWDDLPACTEDSYYAEYTECSGGTRSIIYQKKPEADCNGGVPLPPTQTGLPCALSCPPGQYSSPHGCALCLTGHYSLGSAIREDSWQSWSSLQIPFSTYCTYLDIYRVEHVVTDVPCGWVMNGFEINSGSLNNSQSSYLETSVVLLDNGTLMFDYSVDAEPRYDGLTVYVDRVVVLPKVSTQFDFTLTTINLSAGYHFIQFVYSKDQSISSGADEATLNLVQLSPVNYASDTCTPCRAGRYQNSTGKSYCYDCPQNTYSTEGAYRCQKCPPNYYSFEGSATCYQQEPCTEDDAHYLYDSCYFSQGVLKQNQYPVWNQPHICYDAGNVVPPYPNNTVDCVACNPGEHRVGTECVYCNSGEASTSGDTCEICPPGTAAIKALYLDHFDIWGQGLTTDCNYYCGSPGWDLHDDYIDSGSGHGRYVNSNLYLNVTLPVNGFIIFQYLVNCSVDCALDFQFTNGTGASYRGGPNIFQSITPTSQKFSVSSGDIQFRWTFTKNDPDGTGRLDNARIYFIGVSNVENGGAVNCTSCIAGYYSSSTGQTTCLPCPPGTYSEQGASECTTCEDGYFNPDEGQASCIACGESTTSSEDYTDCIVTCQYEVDGEQYDLSPMSRNDEEMYGPIYDFKNQIYYLNLCVREHNNNTCIDIDGVPIDTYACQVTVLGFGVDLGDIFGFIPLRDSDNYEFGGVTVHLTHGENCRNLTSGEFYPRQTYIDVICDPTAGIGSPEAVDTEDNIIETSKCIYEFNWRSLYGCHLCTEDDYTYIISACDNQQKREIQYVWVDNPKSCHGGVSLPDSIELSCANMDSTYCPPGEYLDLTVTVPVCAPVSPGFFSIGGGMLYDSWTDGLPESFSTVGWVQSLSGGIRSSTGTTSLLYLKEFVEVGSISFTYRIFGFGDSTGGFSVYINDELRIGPLLSTNGVFVTDTIPNIEKGHLFVKFEFVEGIFLSTNGGGVGVEIYSVKVLGTSHSAEYQLPCPSGTYGETGASECDPCPENTYSEGAADECASCPEDYYSFPGSEACSPKQPCTLNNYQLVYSDCRNGVRSGSYIPLIPFVCKESIILPSVDDVPCDQFDCEPGEYRDQSSSDCKTCGNGYFWNSTLSTCSKSAPGYAGILQTGWYNQPESSRPSDFSTGCVGKCVDTNDGWRSRSTFLDSGDNSFRHVDVFLDLSISLQYDGFITFDYSIDGDSENGLFVYVNQKQQNIGYHPLSTTSALLLLSQGPSVVRWVYHQESNKNATAKLMNIVVTGAGSSTEQTACPPGTFSENEGSNTCYPCSPGYASSEFAATSCNKCSDHQFAEFEGSVECADCGSLTHSTLDKTDCQTGCTFWTRDDKEIDLNPLSSLSGPFSLTSSSSEELWLNVCSKQNSSVLCIDPVSGDSIDTYSCLVDSSGSGIDSGRLLSITVNDDNSIRMFYSNGGVIKDCNDPITTDLLLTCDPDNDNSEPYETLGSTLCNLRLQWDIAFACYKCNDSDYATRETDCENGEFTSAEIRTSDCYGAKVRNSTSDKCSKPLNVSIFIVLAICLVVVVLVVIVIAIVVWNIRLKQQYTALVMKSSGSYEMSDLPESVTDEEQL